MGIPFTVPMGFLFTMTIGFLFTIALGIQLTISTLLPSRRGLGISRLLLSLKCYARYLTCPR